MNAASTDWVIVSQCESATCFTAMKLARAHAGTTTKPLRSDGNRLLENVPT